MRALTTWFLAALTAGIIAFPGLAGAAKDCRDTIPPEIFAFFGDMNPKDVDCADYTVTTVDLNGDARNEFIINKKQFSCSLKGHCDQEVFQELFGKYKNIGTLPGSFDVLAKQTKGFSDIAVWTPASQRIVYRWSGTRYEPELFREKRPVKDPAENDNPWNSLP
ncbi:MAG: hypothetical protein M5R36_08080 [Deltaproteobacteria bacterium]|nr:hypothetical protein [Deltaproteobacteria bacterium]